MGKLKSILIGAAAICCAILSGTSTVAGDILRNAAYLSAGVISKIDCPAESNNTSQENSKTSVPTESTVSSVETVSSTESQIESSSSEENSQSEPVQKLGKVITLNRSNGVDDEDYSKYTEKSGIIERYNFGNFDDPNVITLSSGAQIRNLTDKSNAEMLVSSEELPLLGDFSGFELGCDEPQVLIYHTHTSESFLPFGESYDSDYPIRSSDSSRNVTAVGDAICEALAKRGISSVHDCTVHDYPMFTGAYYRSADTILNDIKKYPSIKIAIDIHRDGIVNADGSVTAPVSVIDGKSAAQLMIITGCDSPETEIPDYIQNFKLACLLQNSAEKAYPTLARPLLFDYRNYNQSLFVGDLLIEVGSQGNTLEEAVYSGELLGNILADAVERLAQEQHQ